MTLRSPQSAPLAGRTAELTAIRRSLDDAAGGRGRVLFLTGDSGVGKSRLAAEAIAQATARECLIAAGRAHPVERSVAFAFADAFVPLLRSLPEGKLRLLARGNDAALGILFPAIHDIVTARAAEPGNAAELFWCFTQVVRGIADVTPLVVVLDDLQWADDASLDLIHFLARHTHDTRIAIVATVNTEEPAASWRAVQRSLTELGVAETIEVLPLGIEDFTALVATHDAAAAASPRFVRGLHERTRGNPFFAEEILKHLRDTGPTRDAASREDVPHSVRDVVAGRLAQLSPGTRSLAELLSVCGARAPISILQAVAQHDDDTLVSVLEDGVRANVFVEEEQGRTLRYEFRHPILRDVIYATLTRARRRLLHTRIAHAMQSHDAAPGDIAPHIMAGDPAALGDRAARDLHAAARAALARFADADADAYLAAALELIPHDGAARQDVLRDLARARQRLGRFDAAIALWTEARDHALAHADAHDIAVLSRRVALARFSAGHLADAEVAYAATVQHATAAADNVEIARTFLERGTLMQSTGRVAEAAADFARARDAAVATADPALIARCERAFILFHALSGPADRAREHGTRALDAARRSGDASLLSAVHWALSVHYGLTGRSNEAAQHIGEARRIADDLDAPLLQIAAAELAVEHEYSLGEWDRALAIGEGAIRIARALNQRSSLVRLLASKAVVHMGRDEIDEARALVDEAWRVSGAETDGSRDVHAIVPACTARAALHLATGEWDLALQWGLRALVIVDSTGFRAYAVHRLLPTIAEAHYQKNDFASGESVGRRLRADAMYLEQVLGIAFADTSDAIVAWLSGNLEGAVRLLREAADALDAVPYVYEAARLRRQLAGRLADIGDRDAALTELRRVHDTFSRLRAERELSKTRIQFRELGVRPPARGTTSAGIRGLTARELEIVRLVAGRKSNKAIARELDLSARTVTTHLSNIFRKLNIASRGELTDLARTIE